MIIGNILKLIISVLVIVSITFLIFFSKVPSEVGIPVISAIAGYVFGNSTKVLEKTPLGKENVK